MKIELKVASALVHRAKGTPPIAFKLILRLQKPRRYEGEKNDRGRLLADFPKTGHIFCLLLDAKHSNFDKVSVKV